MAGLLVSFLPSLHAWGSHQAILTAADEAALTTDKNDAAQGQGRIMWRIVPAYAGKQPLPGGLTTTASRAILLSDAKRIGWTAFLTPTCGSLSQMGTQS